MNPAFRPVIDKLEADHLVIAGHLGAVEAAAGRISSNAAARTELAARCVACILPPDYPPGL